MGFRVKINKKKLDALLKACEEMDINLVNKNTATDVGVGVTSKMLDLIAKGTSPIKGAGRFPGYKNPAKYPGDLKAKRPVNLLLSGDFLKALDYDVNTFKHGYNTTIYYKGDEDKKESGHREGVHGQPKRPTIPVKGEEFVVVIQRIVSKIFKDRINQLLKLAGLKT